jgi:hypothetical protein
VSSSTCWQQKTGMMSVGRSTFRECGTNSTASSSTSCYSAAHMQCCKLMIQRVMQ